MRKISFTAVAAIIILIGVGAWVGASTVPTTPALAASTSIDPSGLTNAKDLPTSHYDDYSLVFPAVIGR
jgi:hypothetical protein